MLLMASRQLVLQVLNPKSGPSNLDKYQSLIKSSILMINMDEKCILGDTNGD